MDGQVISLGLGSPADIAVFVLVGLSPTGPVILASATDIFVTDQAADRLQVTGQTTQTITVEV